MTDETTVMRLNIPLSSELKELLQERADKRGCSVAELVRKYAIEQSRAELDK